MVTALPPSPTMATSEPSPQPQPGESPPPAPAVTNTPDHAVEVPQFRLPPFTVPEGVSIVPFADWQPRGILLPAVAAEDPVAEGDEVDDEKEERDDAEVDAAGVPTVQLETSHDPIIPAAPASETADCTTTTTDANTNTNDNDKAEKSMPADAAAVVAAHRRRRNKGRRMELKELGIMGAGANGEHRLTWWEKWELEDRKKHSSGISYSLGEDRSDRLDMAVKMFRKGHAMEAGVQSIWDRWLDYIGLMRNENQIPGRVKISRGIQRRDEEFSDEEMDEPGVNLEEVWEERVIRFLENPTNALRRFFSSTYVEEGLYWSDAKLRDGPILVSIFLRYLLHERVVPEYATDLTRALTFLNEHIKHDLLATRAFSVGAEDDFSAACCADLGTQVLQNGLGRWVPAHVVLEAQAKRDAQLLEAREREKKEIEEERKRRKEERERAIAAGEQGSVWGEGDAWIDGPIGWDEPRAWDWNENGDDPTQAERNNDGTVVMPWGTIRKPTLAPLSTPLTHSLLRTERSVRRIAAVRPPDPNSPDPLRQRYATIVFEPWPLPEVVKELDILCAPEMLYEADGEKERKVMAMRGGGHTLADPIELLVEPEHADRARKGLGVFAVWVQAAKTSELPDDATSPTAAGQPAVTTSSATPTFTPAAPDKTVKSYASTAGSKPAASPTELDEFSGSTTPTLTASSSTSNLNKKKRATKDKGPKAETFWFFQHVTIVVPGYWMD
ncbi:hypothetical protein CALCODRAFT_499666 [Calocera cornea HHB12733]|uniref:Uncharacterized protein n=1 Tax=Calocera cornea HHB12733 TaxID=1353952 RepID=A0A165ED28_9BASI|nr:hypothetical protein CALCODRAFT_499666 [Calocera cornea HHB12733]